MTQFVLATGSGDAGERSPQFSCIPGVTPSAGDQDEAPARSPPASLPRDSLTASAFPRPLLARMGVPLKSFMKIFLAKLLES